jgi:hypothetical protein
MSQDPSGFLCRICGERHVLALSYSVSAPFATAAIPAHERATRILLSPEQCVIDDTTFFLRGRIPVPIHGLEEPFIWGVWAEISPKNFLRTTEIWNATGREEEPPFTGYLDSQIPIYGDTHNLVVDVHTQPIGQRPSFFVNDPAHPLAIEQREGITLERIEQIALEMIHPEAFTEPPLQAVS